jgi:yecA family protein
LEANPKNDVILPSLKIFSDFLIDNKGKNKLSMDVTMVQGFLYAVISAPCFVVPNDWMIAIFGEIPEFESLEAQEKTITAVLDLYNSIENRLSSHSKDNMYLWGRSGQMISLDDASDRMMFDFCVGYTKGYLLDPMVKDLVVDLPDHFLLFFLSVIKLCEERDGTETAVVDSKIDADTRNTLQHLLLENYITWSEAHKSNLQNSYFAISSDKDS